MYILLLLLPVCGPFYQNLVYDGVYSSKASHHIKDEDYKDESGCTVAQPLYLFEVNNRSTIVVNTYNPPFFMSSSQHYLCQIPGRDQNVSNRPMLSDVYVGHKSKIYQTRYERSTMLLLKIFL